MTFSDLTPQEAHQLYSVDHYSEDNTEKFQLADKRITTHLLAEAMHTLPEEKRNTVLLYYFLQLSDQEISEQLKVPRSTVQYRRASALDSDTLRLLQEWQAVQENQCKTHFILSYNGMPTQKHTISYAITRFAKAANIHRIKIHGLRHSHASLLISMGENPLVIKDRLGHEDIQTTLGTYGHLYPNSNFQVADRLSSLVQLKTSEHTQIEHYSSNQFVNTTFQSVP
nr:tyrosine-type recombinase/integrase [Salinicoccus halitifaciens]